MQLQERLKRDFEEERLKMRAGSAPVSPTVALSPLCSCGLHTGASQVSQVQDRTYRPLLVRLAAQHVLSTWVPAVHAPQR